MQAFTDFILEVTLPPNPIREPRQLARRTAQQDGPELLLRPRSPTSSPTATAATRSTRRRASSAANGAHDLRGRDAGVQGRRTCATPTRRSACSACRSRVRERPARTSHQGDQVRGFGFLHDGSIDTVFDFLQRDRLRRLDQSHEQRATSSSSSSPSTRPRADRRPAGHAHRGERRRSRRRRASTCSASAPRPPSCWATIPARRSATSS